MRCAASMASASLMSIFLGSYPRSAQVPPNGRWSPPQPQSDLPVGPGFRDLSGVARSNHNQVILFYFEPPGGPRGRLGPVATKGAIPELPLPAGAKIRVSVP